MSADGHGSAAPTDGVSVFVSYPREDQPFVTHELMPRLRAGGKQAWVDVESIEPAADWRDRIGRGIAGASAFVFLLSPESLDSSVCADEVRQASELNKRIVPVVRRDIDHGAVPEALERPNWIWMREADDLDEAMTELVTALDTDLEWLDAHTRLAVRAREWDTAGRDASSMLRGRDLDAAESWLRGQEEHRERPTALQTEFIHASRAAATRRQRRLLGAAAAAVLISLALAVVALWQRNEAIHQRNQSRSAELAAVANNAVGRDPELAVLLAREGARAADTPEVTAALRNALLQTRVIRRLHHGARVNRAVFSDANTIATAGQDRAVKLWDARTGRQRATLRERGPVFALEPDATGRWLLTAVRTSSVDGALRLWDLQDRRVVRRIARADSKGALLRNAAMSADGRRAVALDFGLTRAIDVDASGSRVVSRWPPGPQGDFTAAAGLSRDGRRMLLTSELDFERAETFGTYSATIVDIEGSRAVRLLGGLSIGTSARFSPDGKLVVTTGPATTGGGSEARVWRVRDGREVAVLRGHTGDVVWAEFSPDGRRIVTAGKDATARVFIASTGRQLLVLRGHSGPLRSATFDPTGERVLTGAEDGTAIVWDVRTPSPGKARDPYFASGEPEDDVSPDATRAAYDTLDGVILKRVSDGVRVATLPVDDADEMRFSADGRWLIVTRISDGVVVFDAQTGRRSFAVPAWSGDASRSWAAGDRFVGVTSVLTTSKPTGMIEVLDAHGGRRIAAVKHRGDSSFDMPSLSPDGKRVVAIVQSGSSDQETAEIRDVATGRLTAVAKRRFELTESIEAPLFSPDGRQALVVANNLVHIFDAANGREAGTLGGHRDTVLKATYSSDGQHVVTASDDGTARVWDAGGATVAALRPGAGPVTDATFSADGSFVVTAAAENAVRVWNATTGSPVDVLRTRMHAVRIARFAPDGRTIVALGDSGELERVACHLCGSLDELLAVADLRLTRELTKSERARYLHE